MNKRESLSRLKVEERFSIEILYSDESFKEYNNLNVEDFLAEIFLAVE